MGEGTDQDTRSPHPVSPGGSRRRWASNDPSTLVEASSSSSSKQHLETDDLAGMRRKRGGATIPTRA
jgi:hypothetical protein